MRFKQLQATGAGTVVTACPFCSIMLKGAQASANAPLEFVDLMTFVNGRLKQAGRPAEARRERRRGLLARVAHEAGEAAAIAAVGLSADCGARLDAPLARRGLRALRRARARPVIPPIMAFWHGRILPATYYFRHRGIVVITSENFDGEWIAGIIERFGYGTARGSTSRGARAALLQLVRDMRAGKPAGVHGGRPAGAGARGQPGAVWLAKATGDPILPFHIEADRYWTLSSWDRTQIPKPFARVAMVIGEPIYVPRRRRRARRSRRIAWRWTTGCRRWRRARVRPGGPGGVMALLILESSDRFAEHTTPPGPSRAARARGCHGRRRAANGGRGARRRARAVAGDARAELARVHTPAYLELLESVAGRAAMLDPDTYTSPESLRDRAAGGGRRGRRRSSACWAARRRAPLALVRPPGHHAERDRAHGLLPLQQRRRRRRARARAAAPRASPSSTSTCTTATARRRCSSAIRACCIVSTHQFPYYPGTARRTRSGRAPGEGFTVNVPLEAGATDADYRRWSIDEIVVPVLAEFEPDADARVGRLRRARARSAGGDAHDDGGVRGADACTSRGVADRCCGGRLVVVTEGGYDLPALRGSLRRVPSRSWRRRRVERVPASAGQRESRSRRAGGRSRRAASSRAFWRGL